MSAENIRDFCVSRLCYTASLGIIGGDDVATLTITAEKLKPEHLMGELGFDEETRIWAGILYETSEESNALSEYADYSKPYRPDHGGDNDYDGEYEHDDSYGAGIDISRFISPRTKSSVDLTAYAIRAWESNWGYVWSTFGNVLTESLLEYKIRQYPDGVGNYEDFIRVNWLNRRMTDCVGLIKGYGRLGTESLSIQCGTNGMPDYNVNQMHQSITSVEADHDSISAMPEIVGLAVWKEGYIGVYIGGGYIVKAASTTKDVIKT